MKRSIVRVFVVFAFLVLFFIPNKSWAMKIVLDPGHGGVDSGAINGSLYERDITLKTARYLRDYLQEYDVEILLTHNGLSSTTDFSVYDRAMFARNNNADLLVCLHYNSGNGMKGAEMWVTANKSLYKYNTQMTELGNKILANLGSLGIANRGVKTKLVSDSTDIYTDGSRADYYGIIRYAMRGTRIDYGVRSPAGRVDANIQNGEGVPTILVEHCFIQADYTFIDSDEDIRRIAEADGKAIVDQYGLKKKEVVISAYGVNLSESEVHMLDNDTQKLRATVLPLDANNKDVTWSSSNPDVAVVDNDGVVTAKTVGNTVITVKTNDGDKSASCNIVVSSLGDEEYIRVNNLRDENGYLSGIKPDTTIEDFYDNFEVSNGLELDFKPSTESLVGTTMKVLVSKKESGDVVKEYTCVFYGDANGDGVINSADLLKIQKHLLKVNVIGDGATFMASDPNKDGIINSADLLKIQKYLLKVADIDW